MNRKQLLIVIVLGIVFGAIALNVSRNRKASFQTGDPTQGNRVLADFPLNEVAHVRIKDAGQELNLVKTNDQWVVNERAGYPANFAQISEFLRSVWELKPIERVTVGASQLPRLHLTPPEKGGATAATHVEFKDKSGKVMNTLTLGKQHMRESQGDSPMGGGPTPVGRYVLVQDKEPKVFLVSQTFSSVAAKPEAWLNKDFFKVEKVRSVSVTGPTNNWKVVRETESGEFKLADAKEGEALDATKASGLGWVLSSPTFNDVAAPDAKGETTGFDTGTTAVIETFDNFTYTVKLGNSAPEDAQYFKFDVAADLAAERKPATDEKPEDKEKLDTAHQTKLTALQEKLKKEQGLSKWTYLVGKWTVESLLKSRQDLLVEKKPEAAAPGATNNPAAPTLEAAPAPFPALPQGQ